MGTTPPTDDQDSPEPEGPTTGPEDAVVEPDDQDDREYEPHDPTGEMDSPETPISVAALLRREGYDPDPDLEWEAAESEERPTEVITPGSGRLRRVLIGAGSAAAVAAAVVGVLVVTTSGDKAPTVIPVEPTPGTAAPYLEPLPPSSSTAPAPTGEPADDEPAAPAAVLAPVVVVQTPAAPGTTTAPPPAAPVDQPEQESDEPDEDAGDEEESSSQGGDGADDGDQPEDSGSTGDGAADRDESDAPEQERPPRGPIGGIVDGLGGVLGLNR